MQPLRPKLGKCEDLKSSIMQYQAGYSDFNLISVTVFKRNKSQGGLYTVLNNNLLVLLRVLATLLAKASQYN